MKAGILLTANLFLVIFTPMAALRAQSSVEHGPVVWSLDNRSVRQPLQPGDVFRVQLAATIANGWHVYSISQPPGGPVSTTISIPEQQPFTLADEIQGPEPEKTFDPNFQMETEVYSESASFIIPLKVATDTTGKQKLQVMVRFQACNDTTCLLPRAEKLETEIEVAAGTPRERENLTNSSISNKESAKSQQSLKPSATHAVADFAFTDFTGKARKLSEFKGKFVLLDFWATWCNPCLADIPKLKALYDKHKASGFEIIGMDSETIGDEADAPDPEFAKETAERAKQIVGTRGVTWTQATSETSVPIAMKIFGVKALPAKILIDREGHIVATIGEKDELTTVIEKHLKEDK